MPDCAFEAAGLPSARALDISGGNVAKLIVALVLPALAIVVAAAIQFALNSWWPGLQHLPVSPVTLDSYVAVLLILGLCVLAGRWTRRNANSVAGLICVAALPLVWLGVMLWVSLHGGTNIAWFQPLTLFTIFAALAPVIGVAMGWAVSQRRTHFRG
jgi:hypothetical protein